MLKKSFLVPEWEKQKATILIFPSVESDWNCCFDEVSKKYFEFLEKILRFQKVILIVDKNADSHLIEELNILDKKTENKLQIIQNINFNDTWARDSLGLILKTDDKKLVLDFNFNAWGGKFDAELDNKITENLFKKNIYSELYNQDLNYLKLENFVEGGALETNGELLIATTKSIINQNRFSENKKSEIEEIFKKYFSINEILWLENGDLPNDDTDSHIDLLVRFANKKDILYTDYRTFDKNIDEEIYHSLKKMEKELIDFNNSKDNFYNLIPVPTPVYKYQDEFYPASYLNFIFVNNAIILPIYGTKTDDLAVEIFHKAFPDREIITQDSTTFIRQGGSFHCLTMQLSE